MRLYADSPARRTRQALTDLLVLAWLWAWIWLATELYHLVLKLGVPGQKLEGAGNGMAGGLNQAGGKVDDIPGVGGGLAGPLRSAASAARSLAEAGRQQVAVVHDLAWALALLLLLVPVAVVVLVWLPLRVRWIRRASTAARLRTGPAGNDLLALRALANQPLRRIAALGDDPVGAWRRGELSTVDSLATLELHSLGLRPLGRPAQPATGQSATTPTAPTQTALTQLIPVQPAPTQPVPRTPTKDSHANPDTATPEEPS